MAEAQTLTYDSNEQAEGELTEEEKSALEVGEKLAEQQNELLAGKFKDAEELEKGYIELQKKLGSPEEKTEEKAPEQKEEEKPNEIDTSFLNTLWDEANKGEYQEETLKQLANMDSREIAQMYLKDRSEAPEPTQTALSQENVTQLKGVVGGEGEYTNMMQWAGTNLTDKEQKMYDAVMDKGDPMGAYFAVQALAYRYNDAKGVDGEMFKVKHLRLQGIYSKAKLK